MPLIGWHFDGLSFGVVFVKVPNACLLRSVTAILACTAWMKNPLTVVSGLIPRMVTENK